VPVEAIASVAAANARASAPVLGRTIEVETVVLARGKYLIPRTDPGAFPEELNKENWGQKRFAC
jgi:hypothetical protein